MLVKMFFPRFFSRNKKVFEKTRFENKAKCNKT